MKGCNHSRSCLRNDRFSIPIWIALVSHFWIQNDHTYPAISFAVFPSQQKTIHSHPIFHLEISTWLVFFQCSAIACLIVTSLEITQKFLFLPVSKDLINLIWPTSTWKHMLLYRKNICVWNCLNPHLLHHLQLSSCRWGRDFACLRSRLNMLFYPGKLLLIQKKGLFILIGAGRGSKHWGHLFANCEPLGQNELKDLKFCVDCLVKFQTCTINFYTNLLLLMHSFLECSASKCQDLLSAP